MASLESLLISARGMAALTKDIIFFRHKNNHQEQIHYHRQNIFYALLLSNLLEEAFVLQEEGGQEIRLGLHHDGQQCRLEFRERQGALEHLDENSRAFLDDFVEKYGVRMETSEEGGWHVLSLQWGSRG